MSWTRSLVGSTSRKGSRGRCCPPAGRRFLGLSFRPILPSAELEIAEMIGLVSQVTLGLNRVHFACNCLEYRKEKLIKISGETLIDLVSGWDMYREFLPLRLRQSTAYHLRSG